jgi:hypothetical protein
LLKHLNKAWMVAVLCTQTDNSKAVLFYLMVSGYTYSKIMVDRDAARLGMWMGDASQVTSSLSRTGIVLPPAPYRMRPLLNWSDASSLHLWGAMSAVALRPGGQVANHASLQLRRCERPVPKELHSFWTFSAESCKISSYISEEEHLLRPPLPRLRPCSRRRATTTDCMHLEELVEVEATMAASDDERAARRRPPGLAEPAAASWCM